ncbi:DUF1540 domain-containing protein [Thermohalobacter berrensis]|uniref:DUF1540 domain-containing protein n=1 Tax=Thermohalobacter berrensis TaxID=99594 RepID=A0A419T2B3_9FIRM|nr:DUF1540 domain-containing protein [Thermohalobacter berrensis]RKD31558.1 DUF1540 domain-containing protein [Thermohalobacter berrensis]
MRIEKSNNSINRVKCCVNSCYYYGEGDHCLASKIEIQPPNAQNTQETDCATFAPKTQG